MTYLLIFMVLDVFNDRDLSANNLSGFVPNETINSLT